MANPNTSALIERLKLFRARAKDARSEAALSKGKLRVSFLQIAEQWDMLAAEAESLIAGLPPDAR